MDQESDKTLYIHVGGSKTGTTSIQTFVTHQREKLLSQYGLYFPRTGSRQYSSGAQKFIIHRHLIRADDTVWERLRAEVAAQGHSKVLLSEEDMLNQIAAQYPQDQTELLQKIRTCFPDYNIKIVLYLRRFDDEFKSMMNQFFKTPVHWLNAFAQSNGLYGRLFRRVIGIHRSIADYPNNTYFWGFITSSRIEMAIKIFGKENFIIRLYDRSLLKNGNIVEDFFDALDIELQGELLEAARHLEANIKVPDEALPFLSKLYQVQVLSNPEQPFAEAVTSKIKAAFDPAQQGSLGGGGMGLESEIGAVIDGFEALAPGYKDLFKNRPCSFAFPEIDLDPKELLKFDLLCSLYKNDFGQTQAIAETQTAIAGIKTAVGEVKRGLVNLAARQDRMIADQNQMIAEIKRALFPNLAQRLVLLLYRPLLKLSLAREQYAVFRKAPEDFLTGTGHSVKRLRKILRFFGPIPPTRKSGK